MAFVDETVAQTQLTDIRTNFHTRAFDVVGNLLFSIETHNVVVRDLNSDHGATAITTLFARDPFECPTSLCYDARRGVLYVTDLSDLVSVDILRRNPTAHVANWGPHCSLRDVALGPDGTLIILIVNHHRHDREVSGNDTLSVVCYNNDSDSIVATLADGVRYGGNCTLPAITCDGNTVCIVWPLRAEVYTRCRTLLTWRHERSLRLDGPAQTASADMVSAALHGRVLYVAARWWRARAYDVASGAELTIVDGACCTGRGMMVRDGVLYTLKTSSIGRTAPVRLRYWLPDAADHGACPPAFRATVRTVLACAVHRGRMPLEMTCLVLELLARVV